MGQPIEDAFIAKGCVDANCLFVESAIAMLAPAIKCDTTGYKCRVKSITFKKTLLVLSARTQCIEHLQLTNNYVVSVFYDTLPPGWIC